jgi:hypothetical protein
MLWISDLLWLHLLNLLHHLALSIDGQHGEAGPRLRRVSLFVLLLL